MDESSSKLTRFPFMLSFIQIKNTLSLFPDLTSIIIAYALFQCMLAAINPLVVDIEMIASSCIHGKLLPKKRHFHETKHQQLAKDNACVWVVASFPCQLTTSATMYLVVVPSSSLLQPCASSINFIDGALFISHHDFFMEANTFEGRFTTHASLNIVLLRVSPMLNTLGE